MHPQKQAGLNWIGVALKLGHLSPMQIRGLAKLSADFGDGDIRLTVWQNLLISGVADANGCDRRRRAIDALGLDVATPSDARRPDRLHRQRPAAAFAAANTKENADAIAAYVRGARCALDTPVNIHLTGCPNSCAQHYIGDIGLIGARVPINDDGDTVEGYHIHRRRRLRPDAAIARELFRGT